MADDIVDRLHALYDNESAIAWEYCNLAADEIERLRAAGNLMWHSLLMWQSKYPDRDIGTDAVAAWEEARRG